MTADEIRAIAAEVGSELSKSDKFHWDGSLFVFTDRFLAAITDGTATSAVGAAPLPDEVQEMVDRLRAVGQCVEDTVRRNGASCSEAADMIERLAAERDSYKAMVKEQWAAGVPPDCAVVPREPTQAMYDAADRPQEVRLMWAAMIATGEVK